ncbi:MAG: hypothetical protein KDA60_21360, partial [Planctomycetales bacterium]|nr:hypothetical protein [Planctomycetales bacterium]
SDSADAFVTGVKPPPQEPQIELRNFDPTSGLASFTVRGVSVQASGAWVGVIPSYIHHGDEVLNDQHDVAWTWVMPGDNQYTLAVPADQAYDLRLHPCWPGCYESAHIPLAAPRPRLTDATQPGASLTLSAGRKAIPGQFSVTVASPYPLGASAWVGVIPAGIPHGTEAVNDAHDISYVYVEGITQDTVMLPVPLEDGVYDVRLNSTDDNGVELASARFSVRGGSFMLP